MKYVFQIEVDNPFHSDVRLNLNPVIPEQLGMGLKQRLS